MRLILVRKTCTDIIHNIVSQNLFFGFSFAETSARWPVLFFEVNSVDSWSRHRTEGYAYAVIPAQPGAHELALQCWRPVGSSIVCELRRFYIGGSPELEDPTYPYIPNSFDVRSSSYHSRLLLLPGLTFRAISIRLLALCLL